MKKLFLVLMLLSSTVAYADYGKPLALSVDPTSGNYQLGVHFRYDAGTMGEKFYTSWSILFGSKITTQELASLPPQVKWNIFDSKANKYIDDWSNRPSVEKNTLFMGNVGLEDDLAVKVIGNQASILLVFADQNGKPLYSLNVGDLCKTLPGYFVNATDPTERCDQVSNQEILSAKTQFCKESADELLGYIKEGTISCAVAQDMYSKKSCGQLSCK